MGVVSSSNYQYQPGGSLPLDAPTYVTRQADQDLYNALLVGDYCYILNARQMGKSSLRIRAMGLLRQQGIACADIELSGIGSQQITAAQWYGGLIQELVSGFELSFKHRAWIQERQGVSPIQRLAQFLETVLLAQIDTSIVIFIDEIDSVLGLSFPTDDFFALIRHCYEKRATSAAYRRLTFVLLGVATPSDLMRSNQYSPPFNIGRAISLQGFQLKDCVPLIKGLKPQIQLPDVALEEILRWSGGQPFLTQKLCWLITQWAASANSEETAIGKDLLFDEPTESSLSQSDNSAETRAFVTRLVHEQILQNWEANDEPEHLRTIRDRILREARSNRRILEIYRGILQTGSILFQDLAEHLKLRLSGVVDIHQGRLRIKNPIYVAIFNLDWVDQQLLDLPSTAPMQPIMATLVCSRVKDFPSKMAQNESQILAYLQQDIEQIKHHCQQFDGTLLKTLGDQVMVLFEAPEKGLQYAIALQKTFANAAMDNADSLQYRMAIHTGELWSDGQDVMGAEVNLVMHLQTQSVPGGICLSQPTFDRVHRHLVTDIIDLGERSIPGGAEPLRLYQIPPYRAFPLRQQRWWQQLPTDIGLGFGLGIGTASLVIVAAVLGVLQGWELQAFDYMMRARPIEPPDDRLLLITVTEADVQAQPTETRGSASLSDQALSQLLKRLDHGQPRAIGLDIYRERRVDNRYPELAKALATNDRLFAICYLGEPGVPPPPESPAYNHGFNSVVQDRDGVLRRQVLAVSSPTPCQNGYALNWWLASRYLQDEGITLEPHDTYLQLGTVPFKRIRPNMGGYRRLDISGHQILINYRATEHIAEQLTLSHVLSDQFDPSQVRDRIVLIGVVAPSFNDHDWFTPYSGGQNSRRMTGVEIQAHMTSQIISAVLDGRLLLWTWSESVEWLWIGSWTVMASIVAMTLRSRRYLALILGGMILILGGICWVFICYAGWIPLIPTALGIAGGGLMVNGYRNAIAVGIVTGSRASKR
ncbi:MAG: CHASE2 domain-containing protein [Cyanobacteria bacterium P01_B01_bin.77]